MAITLHTISASSGSRAKSRRIGRGPGSGRGKTAGKGTKGQRSRTGGKSSLKLKGMKQMLLSFPKNRGFRSRFTKDTVIRVGRLSELEEGTTVTMKVLQDADLMVRTARSVKIVAGGDLKKKLTIAKGVTLSAGAKAEIERAGGTIA